MLIVSHRGNINGRIETAENHPDYILKALSLNFDVEVDVWNVDGDFYLGHDSPSYKINIDFLNNKKIWCHSKNFDAFINLRKNNIHTFWHENDKMTLTTKNIIWCYENVFVPDAITVCLNYKTVPKFIKGVCTDYPWTFKTANVF